MVGGIERFVVHTAEVVAEIAAVAVASVAAVATDSDQTAAQVGTVDWT